MSVSVLAADLPVQRRLMTGVLRPFDETVFLAVRVRSRSLCRYPNHGATVQSRGPLCNSQVATIRRTVVVMRRCFESSRYRFSAGGN